MPLPTLGIYGPSGADRSGVATYIRDSLPHLEPYFSSSVISNSDPWKDPGAFDFALYHLGNNGMHLSAFKAASARPGVSLLHEYLHLDYYYQVWDALDETLRTDILVTLRRASGVHATSAQEFIDACKIAGSVDPYALDIGIEGYMVERSQISLVHSRFVADMLRHRYADQRIDTLHFPVTPWCVDEKLSAVAMRRYGIEPHMFLFGSFGFIGDYKCIPFLIEAWDAWHPRPPEARLLLAGSRQIDISVPPKGVIETGWVNDRTFAALMRRVDCGIQLRHPSLGETSGPAAALSAHRRPVILSDIPEMRGLGSGARSLFVSHEGAVSDLLAIMRLQHEQGRQPLLPFDEAYSWTRWAKNMHRVLTSPSVPKP